MAWEDTTATVTSMSPLQTWRQQHFGTPNNTGLAADTADGDLDGLTNLAEYGLGTSPTVPSTQPLETSTNAGQFVLQFERWSDRADVTLTLESLSTLSGVPTAVARSQNGAPFVALVQGIQISETGSAPVTVTTTIDLTPQNPHQFFRVKVEAAQ